MAEYDLKEDFFGIYDEHPSLCEEADAVFDAWRRVIPDGKMFGSFRTIA